MYINIALLHLDAVVRPPHGGHRVQLGDDVVPVETMVTITLTLNITVIVSSNNYNNQKKNSHIK